MAELIGQRRSEAEQKHRCRQGNVQCAEAFQQREAFFHPLLYPVGGVIVIDAERRYCTINDQFLTAGCCLSLSYGNCKWGSRRASRTMGVNRVSVMANNVVDLNSQRENARHRRKEKSLDDMQKQFERALPTEKSSKDKLLDIFRRKKSKK